MNIFKSETLAILFGWDAGKWPALPCAVLFLVSNIVCDAWASLGCWPICAPCGRTLTKLCGNGRFQECLGVFVEGGRLTEHDRGLSPASAEETGMKASGISREHYVILWAVVFRANKTLVLQRTHLKAAYSGTGDWGWVVNSLKSAATFSGSISV